MERFTIQRERMVETQIRRRGISDTRVLDALRRVPRHVFVPNAARGESYEDTPLSIGHGQTISQPYIVALMTSALDLRGCELVLEIGTGSGYQTAILSCLAREVHTIEILPQLAERAARLLRHLGCTNTRVHIGDGSLGWPENAPYDAILVAAAAPRVPAPLRDQMVDGGRLLLPVAADGGLHLLTLIRKQSRSYSEQVLASVCFVPLLGAYGVHGTPP